MWELAWTDETNAHNSEEEKWPEWWYKLWVFQSIHVGWSSLLHHTMAGDNADE